MVVDLTNYSNWLDCYRETRPFPETREVRDLDFLIHASGEDGRLTPEEAAPLDDIFVGGNYYRGGAFDYAREISENEIYPQAPRDTSSWLKKIPILPIAALNVTATFWGGVGARWGFEKIFPRLSKKPMLSPFFTPRVTEGVTRAVNMTQFRQTMKLATKVIPLFAMCSLLDFIPLVKDCLEERKKLGPQESYAGRFLTRGAIGVTRLMGERESPKIEVLQDAKDWLNQRPEPLANFFGRVTPSEAGKFGGLALDIFMGTLHNVADVVIFGARLNLSTFNQALIINILTSYANVCITQHSNFSDGEIWGYRTVIGILKGSFYKGICATPSVRKGTGFFAQAAFGLGAITYVDHITRERKAETNYCLPSTNSTINTPPS